MQYKRAGSASSACKNVLLPSEDNSRSTVRQVPAPTSKSSFHLKKSWWREIADVFKLSRQYKFNCASERPLSLSEFSLRCSPVLKRDLPHRTLLRTQGS